MPRRAFSSLAAAAADATSAGLAPSRLASLRADRAADIVKLVEVQHRSAFSRLLSDGAALEAAGAARPPRASFADAGVSPEEAMLAIEAGFHTFNMHVESRIASLLGEGFYTIGPCGEELMAGVGLALRPTDPAALHYRHLGVQVARQLRAGRRAGDILLDRARAHACSALDPVTGGVHCSLGGGPADFLVTSTLASQAPPAVGRALGAQLAHALGAGPAAACPFPRDAASFVSVGDGSVNNAHFLAAVNTALYAQHRGFKCPVVFCVTDNDRCISLRGHGWLPRFVDRVDRDVVGEKAGMLVARADGWDLGAVRQEAGRALAHARRRRRPALLVVEDVPRRFGHAATDRQLAYSSSVEIDALAAADPLAAACGHAVAQGVATPARLAEAFAASARGAAEAFCAAADEPKLTSRAQQVAACSAPLAPPLPSSADSANSPDSTNSADSPGSADPGSTDSAKPPLAAPGPTAAAKPDVMRKHMTRVLDEALTAHPECVYVGEDVEHGGYYLVTDGLARAHPGRVADFPPDETSLMGAAIGYSQAGLLPIVEIPYAKYLECAQDMFSEACLSHWLSAGRQRNGMVVRLQGFGRGVFGGNFHTHNSLSMPPGLDVVCFSNGRDYARGFRHALRQAKAGRVVMTVDCTALLNERHVHGRDGAWATAWPERAAGALGGDGGSLGGGGGDARGGLRGAGFGAFRNEDELTFDDVIVRPHADVLGPDPAEERDATAAAGGFHGGDVAIVAYGDGVLEALRAARALWREHGVQATVIDSPLLSDVPARLPEALSGFDRVVFADVCKDGQNPFARTACALNARGELPRAWTVVAAARAYNPLGNLVTFLSADDVRRAALELSLGPG
jgi:2-oxoisovalerate dehydrogenase E1 component